MGIKDTGDYLTIKFANPQTGVVSPSVCGVPTPGTPLTPAEALNLFSGLPRKEARPPRPRPGPHRQHAVAARRTAYRWRQQDGHWLTDASRVSPRISTANSSATRSKSTVGSDGLFLPAPISSVDAPAEHDPLATVRKMPSIGAGPRKFAAASRALRECSDDRRPTLQRRVTAIRHPKLAEKSSQPPISRSMNDLPDSANQVARSTQSGTLPILPSLETKPDCSPYTCSLDEPKKTGWKIARKPVGTPPLHDCPDQQSLDLCRFAHERTDGLASKQDLSSSIHSTVLRPLLIQSRGRCFPRHETVGSLVETAQATKAGRSSNRDRPVKTHQQNQP